MNDEYDEQFRRSFGWTVLLILILLPFAVWLLLWLSTNPADAQENSYCKPVAEMEAWLLQNFQEEIVAAGIDLDPRTGEPTGTFTETFASPNGETWTTVELRPNTNIACMVRGGKNWVQIPFVPPRAPEAPRRSS